MEKIFIGGWSGTGSRLPPTILRRAGYFGEENVTSTMDYCGNISGFHKCFRMAIKENNLTPMKEFLDKRLQDRDSWSLKAGHFMCIVPALKKWYPGSKFILTVRHPVDCLIKQGSNTENCVWGGVKDRYDLDAKLEYYESVTLEALKHTDLLVRLEDLCFKPIETISQILELADIDDDPKNYLDIIEVPASIGRGKAFYNATRHHAIIGALGY